MFKKNIKVFMMIVVLLGLLAACGGDTPEAVPEVALATATQPPPTNTTEPTAEATAVPSNTPTATPVPPTATPPPTITPFPEFTITPTPAAVTLITKEDFGTDRNMLTGELMDDPTVLQRRPIAVKISNSPPQYVRPQSGLSQADIVFEHATEGPITRFTAIFYGQTPPDVGPIRSARLIDVELPNMYEAGFAYSGSSTGVGSKLFASNFRRRIIRSYEGGYYRTEEDKPYEHTLYADPVGFWQALDEKEQSGPPEFRANMAFSTELPAGGEPATAVSMNYDGFALVGWTYDEANGRYWRDIDGEPHIDKNNGEQISAANVVMIYAIHVLDRSICEYQTDAGCLSFSAEIQIWGQGFGRVVRDGRAYEITWKREHSRDMFTFYDENGDPLPLQIGNTWFQIVPRHYRQPVTITP